MVELAQLFQDMEAAVVQQEPAIEHIDAKAEDTVVHLDKGNEQLNQAVDKARSARRKKWICFGIVGEFGARVMAGVGLTGLQCLLLSSSSRWSSSPWRSQRRTNKTANKCLEHHLIMFFSATSAFPFTHFSAQ